MNAVIRMNYTEFVYLIFYKKMNCLVNYTYEKDPDEVEYYEIFAIEPDGGQQYLCKINSRDDADAVINFATTHKDKANKQAKRLGMMPEEISNLLVSQQLILRELRLLNKRIEVMVKSGLTYFDLDAEPSNDYYV